MVKKGCPRLLHYILLPAQAFFLCQFCVMFKNIYFVEQQRTATSDIIQVKERERERERVKERETETERQRETERQKKRERQIERKREKELTLFLIQGNR